MFPSNVGRCALVHLDRPTSALLSTCLETLGFECRVAPPGDELEAATLDLLMVDATVEERLVTKWLDGGVAVVIVENSPHDGLPHRGAVDTLQRPLYARHIGQVVMAALERRRLRSTVERLQRQLVNDLPPGRLIGRSRSMRRLLAQLAHAGADERAVALHGERGSGRGLLGRTIADQLGHGLIELRHTEVRSETEVDFIRELLSSTKPDTFLLRDFDRFAPDAQRALVAAMHRPKRKMIVTVSDAGPELGARVLNLSVPALRERNADVLPLARLFLDHFAPATRLSPAAEAVLTRCSWPGNVADLRNTIERAALTTTSVIAPADLPIYVFGQYRVGPHIGGDFTFEQIEQAHLSAVVGRQPKLTDAARVLGIDESTLWRMRKRYEMP